MIALAIEHVTTADMDDGQPLPPFFDGAIWCVVRRANNRTFWRSLALKHADEPPPASRASLGGTTKEPNK
jgi:hypothetical protein